MSAPTTATGRKYFYRDFADSEWQEVEPDVFDAIREQLEEDLPQIHVASVAAIWNGAGLLVIDGKAGAK